MINRKWASCVLLILGVALIFQACGKKEEDVPESEMLKIQDSMLEKFRNTALSSDPDSDFAALVMLYNETAVAFAKKELEAGKNQRMRTIAQEVLTERSKELDELQLLIKNHIIRINIPELRNLIVSNLERTGKNASLQAVTGDIDKDFAAVLIAHNEGLIENANLHLTYGILAPLKTFSKNMISSRDQQTRYLHAWLTGNRNPD